MRTVGTRAKVRIDQARLILLVEISRLNKQGNDDGHSQRYLWPRNIPREVRKQYGYSPVSLLHMLVHLQTLQGKYKLP